MVNNLDIAFICALTQLKDMGTVAFRFGHRNPVYKVSVHNLNAVFHKYNSKKIRYQQVDLNLQMWDLKPKVTVNNQVWERDSVNFGITELQNHLDLKGRLEVF